MLDRFLSRWWSWLLAAISLVAFGFLATLYFGFCWLVSGVIDARLLRSPREVALMREGRPPAEVDACLLPRDRLATLARGSLSMAVAALFHFLA